MSLFGSIAKIAGAAIIGGPQAAISTGLGVLGQSEANKANSAAAQKQMDFQQYNSDTAVQRRVADLQAAGLNPMLAYSDQASTPTGAMSVTSSDVNAGADVSMKNAQASSSSAAAKQAMAQTENIATQSDLNRALVQKAGADTLNSTAQAANTAVNTAKSRLDIPVKAREANVTNSWVGKMRDYSTPVLDTLGRLNPFVSSASGAKKAFDPVSPY